MVFQIDFESEQGSYPFMFSHSWIGELDFNALVHRVLKHVDSDSSTIIQFMDNMRNLKVKMSKWEKIKKQLRMVEIQNIEKNIGFLFKKRVSRMLTKEDISLLVDLEERKRRHLLKEEEMWRLKREDLWIQQGDNNTKLFHKFVSYRRNFNRVQEIYQEDGTRVL